MEGSVASKIGEVRTVDPSSTSLLHPFPLELSVKKQEDELSGVEAGFPRSQLVIGTPRVH